MNTLTVPINATLDGYTPKNNKMFVGPYNYFTITNNSGSIVEFYYEDFRSTPDFAVDGSFEQGCNVMCYPTNSKSTTSTAAIMSGDGWTEGLLGGKLPQVSWTSDYYLNWEAQNGKNVEIQTGLAAAGMALNIGGGLLGAAGQNWGMRDTAVQRGYMPDEEPMVGSNAGGMLGGVLNFASQLSNTMNTVRKAKMVPPQAKGTASTGTLSYATGNATKFTARKMSVRYEYAKMIDDYFTAVGYKVNEFKIPNFTGRANWNYVKTIGFNCEGDVPEGDLQEYKNIFNNGVTLWHNPSTFMDYSQNNNIIGG